MASAGGDAAAAAGAPSVTKRVCVTGGNGFIAAHIVRLCLERGFEVHATVRDVNDDSKTAHLRALPGAAERLQFFAATLLDGADEAFEKAFAGCYGVFHVASPLPQSKVEDPENFIIKPAVEGTLSALRACKKAGVKHVVVTSSSAAIAPVPEPAVKYEEHWSDPEGQRSRGSYYGASKTLAERAAWNFVEAEGSPFRLVTICPTAVIGPSMKGDADEDLLRMFKDGRRNGRCRNDSMSFVDVRDCAAQHLAAMEDETATGRYFSFESSWHWNDLELLLRKIYPKMPQSEMCEGEPCKPTQIDHTRQNALGIKLRTIPDMFREGFQELKRRRLLE